MTISIIYKTKEIEIMNKSKHTSNFFTLLYIFKERQITFQSTIKHKKAPK